MVSYAYVFNTKSIFVNDFIMENFFKINMLLKTIDANVFSTKRVLVTLDTAIQNPIRQNQTVPENTLIFLFTALLTFYAKPLTWFTWFLSIITFLLCHFVDFEA